MRKYPIDPKAYLGRWRVSNSLNPDQDRHSVGPDLGPNCLQRLSADDKSHPGKDRINIGIKHVYPCINICRTQRVVLEPEPKK